jgi:hypothetical protein
MTLRARLWIRRTWLGRLESSGSKSWTVVVTMRGTSRFSLSNRSRMALGFWPSWAGQFHLAVMLQHRILPQGLSVHLDRLVNDAGGRDGHHALQIVSDGMA